MKQNRLLSLLAMLFVVFVISAQTHNITRSGNKSSKPSTATTTKKNNNKPSTINKTGGNTGKTSWKESTNKKQQTITTPKQHTQRDSQGRIQSVASTHSSSQKSRNHIIDNLVNNMVYVDGGTFTMGATSEQGSEAYDVEKPSHQVTLSSFSIGRYEVTQEEWQAVMGSNPSYFEGDKRPVEQVSWDDCQEFIRKLNTKTGKVFRLPTEAEWEFAARGGNSSRGYKYAGSNDIGTVAWCSINSGNETHPVGQKRPNELGLYDMAGNVWEWCNDRYGNYSSSSQTNPTGASSGSNRMFRGGCWSFNVWNCRVSNRYINTPNYRFNNLGLRLAL